ncbi:hypothetical protein FHS63_000251 [Azospirillum doebereinerae]
MRFSVPVLAAGGVVAAEPVPPHAGHNPRALPSPLPVPPLQGDALRSITGPSADSGAP